MTTIKEDADLIKTATGGEGELIAYHYGKSYDWLIKQGNGEYLNFWTTTKRWVRSFGKVEWQKSELFFNDFELFRRELWREVRGLILPFPITQDERIIKIRNLTEELLALG